jgi:hypothetical protein
MFLHSLQEAGYPFGRNDLDLDEWLALGQMKHDLEIVKHDK